jgi:hypothetical protein
VVKSRDRAILYASAISAVGLVVGGVGEAIIQASHDPRPTPPSCAIVAERVVDFTDRHPAIARLYAYGGPAGYQLVNADEAKACHSDFRPAVRAELNRLQLAKSSQASKTPQGPTP